MTPASTVPTVGFAPQDFTTPPGEPQLPGELFIVALVAAWFALVWVRASFRFTLRLLRRRP